MVDYLAYVPDFVAGIRVLSLQISVLAILLAILLSILIPLKGELFIPFKYRLPLHAG